MKPNYYMLSFAVSGIKNIEKEIKIEFYNKVVDKTFEPENFKIKAIYGENGAGKTAIVMATKILRSIIMGDSYLSETSNQNKLHELINKKTKKMAITAEYIRKREENLDSKIYRYCVGLSENDNGRFVIDKESLEEKSGEYASAKYKTLFLCEKGKLILADLNDEDREILIARSQNLLDLNSLIWIGLQNYKENGHGSEIVDFYTGVFDALLFAVNIYVSLEEQDLHDAYMLGIEIENARTNNDFDAVYRKLLEQNSLITKNGRKIVHKKLFENYQKEVSKLTAFVKIFKSDLQSIEIGKKENGDIYETSLIFNYGDYSIDSEFESNGIKKLVKIFNYMNHASAGGIAFIDEMDSNINDIYFTKLIEFFKEYGKGQLCFTTHNTSPMAVLRNNKKSLDFLSNDNRIVSWKRNGNFAPDKLYKQGMIRYLPFNVEPEDFLGVLGE